jgi:hypothetical protein
MTTQRDPNLVDDRKATRAAFRTLDVALAAGLGVTLLASGLVPPWLQTCEATVCCLQVLAIAGNLSRGVTVS